MTQKNLFFDNQHQKDVYFMKLALEQAIKGQSMGEVPIGAIIVDQNNQILSTGTNLRESKMTVLGHAELVALHRANKKRQSWRLNDCTVYTTLEPCLMCTAALVQARVKRVVFAATDPKGGGLGGHLNLQTACQLNHTFEVSSGIEQDAASELLKQFFRKKRKSL